jgi:cobalt/nickel transport system permease protein
MLRLFLAIAVISLSGCLSFEVWPAHCLLMVAMWSAAAICGATFGPMLRRLALFLPFVLAIGLGVPSTQDGNGAWTWTLTIVCRSLVAFFAGLWLVHALPFQELRVVLRSLHVPAIFLDALSFMHRYAVVLWEELARLKTARSARTGRLSGIPAWILSSHLIGDLLIRSWDRAERVHRAMLARGGDLGTSSGVPS